MATAPTKERLFRDDAGAAVEKAARLEDENARLRREVEHLRRGGQQQQQQQQQQRRDTPTLRTRMPPSRKRLMFFLLGAVIGIAAAVASVHNARPRRPSLDFTPPPP